MPKIITAPIIYSIIGSHKSYVSGVYTTGNRLIPICNRKIGEAKPFENADAAKAAINKFHNPYNREYIIETKEFPEVVFYATKIQLEKIKEEN